MIATKIKTLIKEVCSVCEKNILILAIVQSFAVIVILLAIKNVLRQVNTKYFVIKITA